MRVNAIAPGLVATEGIGGPGEALDAVARRSPAGRPGTAAEVAQAAVYLASDESRYVHGTVLTIDGGYSAVATA
ncbi:MAG TPA: SDR family oxidoreductase [Actinomycetes bacterium]